MNYDLPSILKENKTILIIRNKVCTISFGNGMSDECLRQCVCRSSFIVVLSGLFWRMVRNRWNGNLKLEFESVSAFVAYAESQDYIHGYKQEITVIECQSDLDLILNT